MKAARLLLAALALAVAAACVANPVGPSQDDGEEKKAAPTIGSGAG